MVLGSSREKEEQQYCEGEQLYEGHLSLLVKRRAEDRGSPEREGNCHRLLYGNEPRVLCPGGMLRAVSLSSLHPIAPSCKETPDEIPPFSTPSPLGCLLLPLLAFRCMQM